MRPGHDLLVRLLLTVERDASGGERLERAEFAGYDGAAVNAHLEHLARLGFLTTARVFGQKYRAVTRTADGRAWLDDHRDELDLWDGD